MKKIFLAAVVVLLSFTAVQAQVFKKGDMIINAGIGLGTHHGGAMSIPPIGASFEYGIVDRLFDEKSSLGLAGYLGFSQNKLYNNWAGISSYTISYTVLGARANLHYQFVEKLDTYAGIILGYEFVNSSLTMAAPEYSGLGHTISGFMFGGQVGARYYFTDNIAAFAELGYGVAFLQLGVSFKL